MFNIQFYRTIKQLERERTRCNVRIGLQFNEFPHRISKDVLLHRWSEIHKRTQCIIGYFTVKATSTTARVEGLGVGFQHQSFCFVAAVRFLAGGSSEDGAPHTWKLPFPFRKRSSSTIRKPLSFFFPERWSDNGAAPIGRASPVYCLSLYVSILRGRFARVHTT